MKECFIVDEDEIDKEVENKLLEENKILMVINRIETTECTKEKEVES